MSTPEIRGLRDHLGPDSKGRTISDAHHELPLSANSQMACVAGGAQQLLGRSVLLAVSGQLLSALAMIEVDGVARRMLLFPPDVNPDYVAMLIKEAEIDAIVTDQPERWGEAGVDVVPVHFPEPAASRVKDRVRHSMAHADLGHFWRTEDRQAYPGWTLRCDPCRCWFAR